MKDAAVTTAPTQKEFSLCKLVSCFRLTMLVYVTYLMPFYDLLSSSLACDIARRSMHCQRLALRTITSIAGSWKFSSEFSTRARKATMPRPSTAHALDRMHCPVMSSSCMLPQHYHWDVVGVEVPSPGISRRCARLSGVLQSYCSMATECYTT